MSKLRIYRFFSNVVWPSVHSPNGTKQSKTFKLLLNLSKYINQFHLTFIYISRTFNIGFNMISFTRVVFKSTILKSILKRGNIPWGVSRAQELPTTCSMTNDNETHMQDNFKNYCTIFV